MSRFTDIIFDAAEIDTTSLIFTLFSKYLPTLLALIVNAGIIPTLIETQVRTPPPPTDDVKHATYQAQGMYYKGRPVERLLGMTG